MPIELRHIPQLIVGCSILFLGFFVLSRSRTSSTNRCFFIFCFFVATWQIIYFIAYLLKPDIAIWVFKLGYTSVILIPASTYHFSSTYFDFEENKNTVKIFYVISLIFETLLWFSPLYIAPSLYKYAWGFYPKAGIAHPVYMVYVVYLVARLNYHLIRKYIKSFQNMANEKLKARYVVLAVAFFCIAPIDFLPNYGVSIYPVGYIFVAIFSGLMGYGILKYQIMDIDVVIKKTAIYSTSVLLVSIFYTALIFVTHRLFFYGKISQPDLIMSLILILIVSMSLKPIETRIVNVLDRRFFKGTIFEISEQKARLETELERGERLRSVGVLAAGMAHEIKNPLTSLQTFIEYLPIKKDDPEYIERFQRIAGQEILRIKNIVSDLLAFSKPQEPKRQNTDIRKVLLSILDLLNGEFIKYKIKTTHNLQEEASDVLVDSEQIKQAFLNIILNAIDAMKENGGELSVAVSQDNNKVAIAIQDTGCGIDSEKLPYIFDPFYSNKDGGTGLGLAITHSIIKKNGGEINIQSVRSRGTSMQIKFLRIQ